MQTDELIFFNAFVVTSSGTLENAGVRVGNGIITQVFEGEPPNSIAKSMMRDCGGKIIMPGFIDVHTHGGEGRDFKDDSPETLIELSKYFYKHGVTTVLATLSPLSHSLLVPAVRRLADFCRDNRGNTNMAGIHLEGPYINPRMSGGNKKEFIEEPDFGRWREVFEAGNGYIRLMTVAPELEGIERIIEDAVANGIVIALGHSEADSMVSTKAVSLGASQVTHLFNAMHGLHHRAPNLLSTALNSDKLDAQLIADGIHVHPEILQFALKSKRADHLILITDSMRAAGLPDGDYDSAGNRVKVTNGISRMPDGTLAGSTLVYERGAGIMSAACDVDFSTLSLMTSLNAARSLGIDDRTGSIATGKAADFVVLNRNFEISATVLAGDVVFERG